MQKNLLLSGIAILIILIIQILPLYGGDEGKSVQFIADQFLIQGRDEGNPLKIGLASLIYFKMGEREKAINYLEEATKIAERDSDCNSLLWLADIWGAKELGAGDEIKAENYRKLADQIKRKLQDRGGTIRGSTRGTEEEDVLRFKPQQHGLH